VLLENLSTADEAEQVAARILARLRPVILVEGQELLTGASIGIALGPTGYTNPSDMIRDADTAMYQAKSSGKNKCCVFDQPMRERVLARISLERELQAAVDNREFRLAFQPIVELAGGQLEGFEALIRWPRPGRSGIGPAEFIPVAEQTGLIVPISWWVLEEAATTLADWRARRPETQGLWVQVNVNAEVLRQPDFLEQLLALLERHGLPAQALRLEITEGAMLDDAPCTGVTLASIRDAGIRLYLDDFGTGYSSLSYLYRYRVDGLKIDRGFVTDLVDASQPGVVAAILQLAQCLGISVTAEGIENERQLAALQALGCPQGQGYYFSRAVYADEALELAVGREAWAAAR
jgi:EAL domain-containing protein (putative c-di-GMP-specific phosphodiesterase class I)